MAGDKRGKKGLMTRNNLTYTFTIKISLNVKLNIKSTISKKKHWLMWPCSKHSFIQEWGKDVLSNESEQNSIKHQGVNGSLQFSVSHHFTPLCQDPTPYRSTTLAIDSILNLGVMPIYKKLHMPPET